MDIESIKSFIEKSERTFNVWLRCDDIGFYTENFVKLDQMVSQFKVPSVYAVIPIQLEEQTADTIRANASVIVSQHGFNHENNSKNLPCELINDKCLYENVLVNKTKLEKEFSSQFMSMLTPPFNSIDVMMSDLLKKHFVVISTFLDNRTTFERSVSPNVELINWKLEEEFTSEEFVNLQIYKRITEGRDIGICVHCEKLGELGFKYLNNLLSN